VICYTVTFSDILDNLRLITLQYVVVLLIRQYWWLCQCQLSEKIPCDWS